VVNPPDLVLFLTAGLRGDAPDAAGAGQALTQALGDELVFQTQNAYAQASSPFVSFGSLLTARYPSSIPLCGLGARRRQGAQDRAWCAEIPEERETLPGVLKRYGYATALVHADVMGAGSLTETFEHRFAVVSPEDGTRSDWKGVVEQATDWWSANAEKPRLLVVVVGDLFMPLRDDLKAQLEFEAGHNGKESWSDAARASALDVYTSAGVELGLHLAELEAALAENPRPRWWILGGLNGLNLGETEGTRPFPDAPLFWDVVLDRTVRVPLAIRGPGSAPLLGTNAVVELVDVMPTLLGLAGAVVPAGVHGRDLLNGETVDGRAYVEFGDMLALRDEDYLLTYRARIHHGTLLDPKLTHDLMMQKANAHHYTLYDVVKDSTQAKNLWARRGERAAQLEAELKRFREQAVQAASDHMTAERVQMLQGKDRQGYW